MLEPLSTQQHKQTQMSQCSSSEKQQKQRKLIVSNIQLQQEQHPYRIKTIRFKSQSQLLSQLYNINQQNTILQYRIKQMAQTIQILKDRLWDMQNISQSSQPSLLCQLEGKHLPSFFSKSNSANSSQRNSIQFDKIMSMRSSKISKNNNNSDNNREYTQVIRQMNQLKKTHQIQKKLLETDNQRLLKQLLNSGSCLEPNTTIFQKQKHLISQLQSENLSLKQQLVALTSQIQKLNQHNKNIQNKNELLSSKIEQMTIFKPESRKYDKYSSLKQKFKQFQKIVESRTKMSVINIVEDNFDNAVEDAPTLSCDTTNKNVKLLENMNISGGVNSINVEHSKHQKLLLLKIYQLQNQVKQKNQQIKSMLIKLAPILQKSSVGNEEADDQLVKNADRASLLILDVFLQKYKITLF